MTTVEVIANMKRPLKCPIVLDCQIFLVQVRLVENSRFVAVDDINMV